MRLQDYPYELTESERIGQQVCEEIFEPMWDKGRAKGRAESVVQVLERRGVALSPEQRAHILACTDLEQLDRWFDRAFTASDATALFAR